MEYVKLGRTGLEVSGLPRCMSYGVPIGGIMPGASTRRSDIRRSGRERVFVILPDYAPACRVSAARPPS